jgi:hypothetical protein
MRFETYGYEPVGRPLSGTLGANTSRPHPSDRDVPAWDYYLRDGTRELERIKDGYSGAPVYDPHTGTVVAVITHRKGDDKGFAIDLSNLSRVYPQVERFFTRTTTVTGVWNSDIQDDEGGRGEILAKTLDHDHQLVEVDQWFKSSNTRRGIAVVEACSNDCADYLADHIRLDQDHGDYRARSGGEAPAAIGIRVNPAYRDSAFQEGLMNSIPGVHDSNGIHGFLSGAPVHVFYVPIHLEQHGRHLPAMIRGAHRTLSDLGDALPDTSMLILFAAIANQRAPFWWPWYRRWAIDRLDCCCFIGSLRPLYKPDVTVWRTGLPAIPHSEHYNIDSLRDRLEDLFNSEAGRAGIRYEQVRRFLLGDERQAGAIAGARAADRPR